MNKHQRTPDCIAELLVHIGRAARSEDRRSELTAAQWTCLRFFARANFHTRTPSSFARFQATTRGTASQIIKSLESQGLIIRHRSERDGRSVCFDLTEVGQKMLAQDPLRDLTAVISALDHGESDRFLETLTRLVATLAGLKEVPAFGTCDDCSHFTCIGDAAYCAYISAELAAEETQKLCASYRGPTCPKMTEGARIDRA